MPPKTLYETTLDPAKRRLLRVTLEQPMDAENVITDLMGKDASPRFRFIMEQAGRVADLDV